MPRGKKTFPKELLVVEEREHDGSTFLITNTSVDDLNFNEHGKKVAVYKLVEVKTLDVKAELR